MSHNRNDNVSGSTATTTTTNVKSIPVYAASLINPPISTLPPPLDLPVRTSDIGTFKHLLATGRAYINFYKTGLKAVISNYRIARQLVARNPGDSASSTSNTGSLSKSPETGSIPPLLFVRPRDPPPADWTRSDWVLYRRARHDVLRLPAFGMFVLIFDELTPLIVYFFTGVVPSTCRIPNQVAQDEGKAEGRRHGSFDWLEICRRKKAGLRTDLDALSFSDPVKKEVGSPPPDYLSLGPEKARTHATRSLAVVGSKWDAVTGIEKIPPGAWWLKGESRMMFLAGDDELLRRGGIALAELLPTRMRPENLSRDVVSKMMAGLSDAEVRLACRDRGMDVRDRSEMDLRTDLATWLWLTAGRDWEERRRRITALIMRKRIHWPTNRGFELPEWYL